LSGRRWSVGAPAVDAGERSDRALVCSPLLRHLNPVWMWGCQPHADQAGRIALGTVALGFTRSMSGGVWFWIGVERFALGNCRGGHCRRRNRFFLSQRSWGFAGARRLP